MRTSLITGARRLISDFDEAKYFAWQTFFVIYLIYNFAYIEKLWKKDYQSFVLWMEEFCS